MHHYGALAVKLESRLLPCLFAWAALGNVGQLTRARAAVIHGHPLELGLLSELLVLALLLLFNGVLAISTCSRGRLREGPSTPTEIALPLVATYGGLGCLMALPYLPTWVRTPLLTPALHLQCATLGMLAIPLGLGLSLWAARTLGSSFAVLAQVRDVTLGGPYRWLRHPMYAGYMVADLGFFLVHPSLAYALLGLVFSALNVWRMGVEERKLRRVSPAYARYCEVTPRLLPGF